MQDIQKHKIREYLWETDFISLDYAAAKQYMEEHYVPQTGLCTAFRKGNFVGRNLDEVYDNSATIIVNVPAIGNNHASIGVVSGMTRFTEEFMEQGTDTELFKLIPFYTVDGINDAGLFVEINLLTPEQSKGRTTGTTPSVSQLDSICMPMLPRYILDHYANVDDAIEGITKYVSVYSPRTDLLNNEFHFMLADSTKTVILEFVNNQIYVREVGEDKDFPAINSNFYVHGVTLNADKTITRNTDSNVNVNGITPYGSGIERYNKVVKNWTAISNEETTKLMLYRLFFTNAYTANPRMYSEFVSNTETFGNLTITSPNSAFNQIIAHSINEYNNRNRLSGKTWQTIHSVVYNIAKKQFSICVQEIPEYYNFQLKNITNKINKDFIYYTTTAAYTADATNGLIPDKSIVFVKESNSLITHGHNFITGGTPSFPVMDEFTIGGAKQGNYIHIDDDDKLSINTNVGLKETDIHVGDLKTEKAISVNVSNGLGFMSEKAKKFFVFMTDPIYGSLSIGKVISNISRMILGHIDIDLMYDFNCDGVVDGSDQTLYVSYAIIHSMCQYIDNQNIYSKLYTYISAGLSREEVCSHIAKIILEQEQPNQLYDINCDGLIDETDIDFMYNNAVSDIYHVFNADAIQVIASDGSITVNENGIKIANKGVTTDKIANGAITAEKLSVDNIVTDVKLNNNSIVNNHIADIQTGSGLFIEEDEMSIRRIAIEDNGISYNKLDQDLKNRLQMSWDNDDQD